jgi:hypothetical protein
MVRSPAALLRRVEHLERTLLPRKDPDPLAHLSDEELLAIIREGLEADGRTSPDPEIRSLAERVLREMDLGQIDLVLRGLRKLEELGYGAVEDEQPDRTGPRRHGKQRW